MINSTRLQRQPNGSKPGAGMPYQAKLATPFGVVGIRCTDRQLTWVEYLPSTAAELSPSCRISAETCKQIERYLADPEYHFDLPLELAGTPFQKRVWQAISGISSGATLTYQDIARALDTAPRPVGVACGANPIPLVVPCHRVVGSRGIGGFMNAKTGSPIAIKEWLLRHEGG